MSEVPDLANLAIEATRTLTKELYGDLGKPVTSRLVRVLGGAIDIVSLPFLLLSLPASKAVLTLKANLESFARRLATVEEAQLQELPGEIAVPTLQRLSYVSDPDLRDMFVELLAKASDSSKARSAHPSFVHVIENLSPDEARIIRYFQGKHEIPYIKVRLMFNDKEGIEKSPILTGIERTVAPLEPVNIPLYFANLEGLGILSRELGSLSNTDLWYSGLVAYYEPAAQQIMAAGHGGRTYPVVIEQRYFVITAYGHLFIEACLQ